MAQNRDTKWNGVAGEKQECVGLLATRQQTPAIMPKTPEPPVTSPIKTANIFSKLFFTWLYPLLWRGRSYNFSINDLYEIPKSNRSSALGEELSNVWEQEKVRAKEGERTPSLLRCLGRIYGVRYFALGFTLFIEECVIRIGQPMLLGFLMRYFRGEFEEPEGWMFASGFVFASAWYCVQHHPFGFALQVNGMKIRISTSVLIYKKSLKLSLSSMETASEGKIVNLMSNDVSRLDLSKDFMHYIWIAPIQLVIIIYILWTYYGWVSLVGMGILLGFIPFQTVMGKLFGKFRAEISKRTDNRLRLTNELLKAISAIKMYVWEKPFFEQINNARKEEVKILKRTTLLRALNQSVYYVACKIVVFVTLLTYVLTGGSLTAEKVFVTLALYNVSRMTLTLFLPFGVSQVAEVRVALKRIQDFLLLPERETVTSGTSDASTNQDVYVKVENFSGKWGTENVLSNVSFEAKSGDLVGVVGAVGAGKSSLLQAILGELQPTTGSVKTNGTMAFVTQEPWIVWGTVRDNILFGKEFDSDRYDQVVRVCSLKSDFAQFSNGDNTFVGHKGASLSGGQKARISLARAVYSDADIYLLDDPLSAVDARVGRHIYNNCIVKYLKSKLVVLVTHQRQFLKYGTTNVLCLVDGKLEACEDLNTEISSSDVPVETEESPQDGQDTEVDRSGDDAPSVTQEVSNGNPEKSTTSAYAEVAETKHVGLDLYWKYIKSGSNCIGLFILVASNVIAQVLYTGSDYWLKIWTNSNTNNPNANQNHTDVVIYAGIVGALLVFSFLRTSSFFAVCMNASVNLHKRLLSSIISTSMRFFETNSSGRILNRFSKDIATMDDTLPIVFFDTIEVGLQVLGILIVVSIVNPILTIPSTFVCLGFFFIRRLYLQTAQTLKRLEGIARSPLLSHVSSTINGLPTIRAFKAEQKSLEEFCALQDLHSSAWYLVLATTRWLGVTVDWVSILYTASVTVVVMLAATGNADVGLSLSSAMSLTGIMQWGVKQSSETASQIISVERVLEYSDLEPEENEKNEKTEPPATWPSTGRISFNGISLKYADHTVLNNIRLVFEPGHKVGVIGRTGAGKSSLISALLRIVQPEGVIDIDGFSHATITLERLRSSISIIPQTPTLFNDTLRKNLDPLGIYNDAELWSALEDVQLSTTLKSNPQGLDALVDEDGGNFSAGQRQLLCLARVILRKSKIIVLDEATANMDGDTDRIVQETMREKFAGCTVIVVAHRINTVLDADRILVLEGGIVKEFDSPATLLENEQSALSQLLKHANSQGQGTTN